MALWFF